MNWRSVFAISPTTRPAETGGDAPAPASAGRMRSVACVHCFVPFSVPGRAMVLTCPACYKRVQVADVAIDRDERFASIESGGTITIGPGARVVADRVAAGGLLRIDGHLQARDVVAGRVELGPGAGFAGNLRAGSIGISPGATIEGGAFRVDKSLAPSAPLDAMPGGQGVAAGVAAGVAGGVAGAGGAGTEESPAATGVGNASGPATPRPIVLPTTPDRAPMIPAPRPIPMPASAEPAHPPGVVARGKPRQSIVAVRAWMRTDTKR